jgi:membrane-bound lytic murein transglycosylase D
MVRSTSLPATVVAGMLAFSACAPARPASAPTPLDAPPEVAVVVADSVGESPTIVQEKVRAAPRDILGPYSYDLPVESNSWVASELDFLIGQRRDVVARWLKRGDYYEPFIRSVMRAYGVPTDLYYLGMIESAFLPTARSSAGAVGFWQFMPSTGRDVGLRIDSLVDERMDPVRATRAAARHLRSLREEMGDWALAAASYNAGTGRISRGLQQFGVSNFWDLAQNGNLAEETKHYVPRLYATAAIAKGRDKYGFAAPSGDHFAYDSVQVELSTPLAELARIGDVPVDDLTRLNPHLIRGVTPAGGYWVWVPAGDGMTIQRAWLASDFRREGGFGSYAVRKGDTLGELAELSGVTRARIRELNPKADWDELQIGKRLRLPASAARELSARPVAVVAKKAKKETERAEKREAKAGTGKATQDGPKKVASNDSGADPEVSHLVKKGDTLWSIARRYGVTVDSIQTANHLTDRPIQPGMRLMIPVS